MYQPKHFIESDVGKIAKLIRLSPLATFVINGDDGLVVNHIPFVLVEDEIMKGELHAHIPRANPLSKTLIDAKDCVAIFSRA